MNILMVCLGNICRSPLAEGVLQQKAFDEGLSWSVESAGTNGYHVGESPHHFSQKVARQHGIDISRQRARSFTPQDLERFDLIYAMAEDVMDDMRRIAGNAWDHKKVKLFLEELYPGQELDVPDPWYGGEDGFHKVYDMIDRTCDVIIEKYGTTANN